MAADRKRPAKGETLTIRLDAQTRFMLDFMARLKGQTITTVIERAIYEVAEHQHVIGLGQKFNWRHFWDMCEGIRHLEMARCPDLFPSYQEKKRLHFARTFSVFFWEYHGEELVYAEPYIDVLWPHIDDLVEFYDETKAGQSYLATGHRMAKLLENTGLKPPKWPPSSPYVASPSFE